VPPRTGPVTAGSEEPPDGGGEAAEPVGAIERGRRRLLGRVDRAQRRWSPLAVGLATLRKYGDDNGANLAAVIAYWSFFSLFPLLLVFVSVLDIVLAGHPELRADLLSSALSQFPVVGDQVAANIGSSSEVAASRGGGTVGLIVGLVAALWAGMGAVAAIQTAMNVVWDVHPDDRPPWWWVRLRALAVLGVLGLFVALSTGLSSLRVAVQGIGLSGHLLVVVGGVALNATGFLAVYKLVTKRSLRWRQLWPGSLLAGVGIVALQVAGTWYLTRVVDLAGRVYGVFAVVIGLLTWLYLIGQLTVYAAELNTVVGDRQYPRALLTEEEAASVGAVGPDRTGADR
jgi:membrane protein